MKFKLLLFVSLVSFTLQLWATGPEFRDGNLPDELKLELSVYPNPSTGVFFLNIKSEVQQVLKVKIVNLIGQPVEQLEVTTNNETRFDLSNLPKGFYFIKAEIGKQELIKRIVVQ